MSPNTKFLFIKSTFNFDLNPTTLESTLSSSSVSLMHIFDDFDSAYSKLEQDAHAEYSRGIHIYDSIGHPNYEYLFEDYACLMNEDGDFLYRLDIIEVETLLDEPSNIIFVSSLHNTNYKPEETEVIFVQKNTPFAILPKLLENTRDSFKSKFNLSPEDITLCEILAV